MDRTGTRGSEANPQLAGEFGVRGCHKGGLLFVTDLDEIHFLGAVFSLEAIDRRNDAVNTVSRVAENSPHAPLVQPLDQEVADGCHARVLPGMTLRPRPVAGLL